MQANDDRNLPHAVPYDRVLSISYSQGRDPLWNAPGGPAQVARMGGGLLGVFRGGRHWVSLRTEDTNGQFVVLRLGNDEEAKRAIVALEERTGRSAESSHSERMTSKCSSSCVETHTRGARQFRQGKPPSAARA